MKKVCFSVIAAYWFATASVFAQAPTGSYILNIAAACPTGTSSTINPPTCFLPDSYRIEQQVGTTWTKVTVLAPPPGSSVVPTTYTFANQPIPSTLTVRVWPMLYGLDGKVSPTVKASLAKTNVEVTVGVTVTVPTAP